MSDSEAITRGVRVRVRSQFSEENSEPEDSQWFFLYTVEISNEGEETVQLISRHWVITDGAGNVKEVKGPGVVGHQPVLTPGERFQYTSGCPLPTPVGSMRGSYQMVTKNGEQFDAEIAAFTLSEPYALN